MHPFPQNSQNKNPQQETTELLSLESIPDWQKQYVLNKLEKDDQNYDSFSKFHFLGIVKKTDGEEGYLACREIKNSGKHDKENSTFITQTITKNEWDQYAKEFLNLPDREKMDLWKTYIRNSGLFYLEENPFYLENHLKTLTKQKIVGTVSITDASKTDHITLRCVVQKDGEIKLNHHWLELSLTKNAISGTSSQYATFETLCKLLAKNYILVPHYPFSIYTLVRIQKGNLFHKSCKKVNEDDENYTNLSLYLKQLLAIDNLSISHSNTQEGTELINFQLTDKKSANILSTYLGAFIHTYGINRIKRTNYHQTETGSYIVSLDFKSFNNLISSISNYDLNQRSYHPPSKEETDEQEVKIINDNQKNKIISDSSNITKAINSPFWNSPATSTNSNIEETAEQESRPKTSELPDRKIPTMEYDNCKLF